jgi:hypothetical protein
VCLVYALLEEFLLDDPLIENVKEAPLMRAPLRTRLVEENALLREWNALYHRQTHNRRINNPQDNVHIFFTIDCTKHSLWQALVLERSWDRINHIGALTRIVSGCLSSPHRAHIMNTTVLSNIRHGIFFSPTFNHLPNGDLYAPYNRPNAFWYWMNHTLLPEDILINVDPDMVFLRALSPRVSRGRPMAQDYDYMHDVEFTEFYKQRCPNCPRMTHKRSQSFAVGPPWMMHHDDWEVVLRTWVELIPEMRVGLTGNAKWIVEMVAFAAAAAIHELPFIRVEDAMSHGAEGSYWGDKRTVIPISEAFRTIPCLLHYCYTWELGGPTPKNSEEAQLQHKKLMNGDARGSPSISYWHFSKYRIPTDWPDGRGQYPHDVFDCNGPLLQELPEPFEKYVNTLDIQFHRHALMMRMLLLEINDVLLLWRKKHCAEFSGRKSIRTSHAYYFVSVFDNVSFMLNN